MNDQEQDSSGVRPAQASTESEQPSPEVAALRAAVRGQAVSGHQQARIQALTVRLTETGLAYAEYLVRNSLARQEAEAEDMVQSAWARALAYLKGPAGDRIRSELHLKRVLRVAIKQVFLDAVQRAPQRPVSLELVREHGEQEEAAGTVGQPGMLEGSGSHLPDMLFFAAEASYYQLIAALFSDDDAFRALSRIGIRRRPAQFRALVLFQLALFFYAEVLVVTPTGEKSLESGFAQALRRYLSRFCIPMSHWERMERAALDAPAGSENDLHLALLAVANDLEGTRLKPGNLISVLRYELRRCAFGSEERVRGRERRSGKPTR